MRTLIKNALVYTGNIFKKSDVLIEDSVIHSLGVSIPANGVDRVFDFHFKYFLIPGLVDVHVHLREPGFSYKETIKTGTKAAAKAGYTAVCPMPNLDPVPDCLENLQKELDIIKHDAVIDVFPFASITKGRKGRGECVDFSALKDKVIGFSDDGTGVQDEPVMRKAMEECAKAGSVISAHCEVNALLRGGYIHDGRYCRAHGHKGICSESEWKEIERDCRLAEETGCRFHVCHISTKESVQIIREAKARGVKVTCETAPHYLTLCEDDLQEDGCFKMNPPLRSAEDKAALLAGIKDGTIDVIATDHAPHAAEEKARGLEKSAMGITGLETAFPVLYTKLVKTGFIPLEKLVNLMAVRPREIFGIEGGRIEPGAPVDLCAYCLDEKFTVDPSGFESMGRSTPFEGWELYSQNKLTMLRGEIVYETV